MALKPPPKPTEICFQEFQDWTKNVGVKKVQREWEQMAEDGRASGRGVLEELHHRGFQDFHHFQKACERFRVVSWPTEIGELGSGFVLYFQFLATLGVMLFALFLLQLPAMSAYGSEDYACGWHHMGEGEWQKLYSGVLEKAKLRPACPDGVESVDAGYLSPGNVGPQQSRSAAIPALYLVAVVVICIVVFYAYQVFALTDRRVDAATTSPADFAVMASGLPVLATDEKDLVKFFREHAVRGKTDTEIVKVVIGWDAEVREKIDRIKVLRRQLAKLEPADQAAEALKKEISGISSDLNATGSSRAAGLKSSGVVIVTFRWLEDQKKCLERWGTFWARHFNRDANDFLMFTVPGDELPRFPTGAPPVPVNALKVEQAAEPGDIVWEYLAVPRLERLKRLATTWAAMAGVLLVSFLVAWLLILAKDATDDKKSGAEGGEKQAWFAISLVPSFLILANNVAIALFARWLGKNEFHNTHTEADFSLALKMSCGMIANTAGVLYWCKATPREWYTDVSLVGDIFLMMLLNSLLSPLVNALDIGWHCRRRLRHTGCGKKRLTQEKIDAWNATALLASKKNPTPQEQQELATVKRSVEFYKRAYEPSLMKMPRAYANALKTFVCCVLYSPLVPWVSLFGVGGIALQYWVDKYLLLRWYKRPEKLANAAMAKFSLQFIKYFVPAGLALTTWLFLTPSWADKELVRSNVVTAVVISVVFAFCIPLDLASGTVLRIVGCLGFDISTTHDGQQQDYYKAQYMWSAGMKYHKDQFYYKKLPASKNPEFLSPGKDAALGLDDLKAVSGSAVQAMADAAGQQKGPQLRGHFTRAVVGSDASPGSAVRGASGAWAAGAAEPSAAAGGAGAAGPSLGGAAGGGAATAPAPLPPPADAPSAASTEASPTGGPVVAEEPATVPPGVVEEPAPRSRPGGGSGRPFWEYNWEADKWHKFDDDCQGFIESRYGRYRGHASQDNKQIIVKTRDIHISVNFEKMTTKKRGDATIRAVRRCVG